MKPRTLDKERPFGQVYGLNGVHFEQDGRYFGVTGNEVMLQEEKPEPEKPKEDDDNGASVKPAEVVESPELIDEGGKSFEDMHHMQLKQAVKMFGGEYKSRDQAIAFLKGQKAA